MKFLLFLAMATALSLSLLAPAPAAAADTHARGVQAAEGRALQIASWHGRPISRSHQHGATPVAADAVSGIRRGTGYRTPGGSQRVRTIQRRLRQLGYRPGPVDGRFGPRTDAALRWFEYKHGIESRVSIAVVTLTHLRNRATGVTAAETTTAAPRPERALESPWAHAQAPSTADDAGARPHVDDTARSGIFVGLVLLGAAAFVAGFVNARARQRRAGPVQTADRSGVQPDDRAPRRPADLRPTARPSIPPNEEVRPRTSSPRRHAAGSSAPAGRR